MKRLLLLLLLVAACTGSLLAEDPVWNKQSCDHCKMIVGDKRYAASLIDGKNQRHFFDDIGCMAAFESENDNIKVRWVRDERSGTWLDATKSFFREGASTPMDYGYSAHAEAPGATYAEVRQKLAEKGSDHAN